MTPMNECTVVATSNAFVLVLHCLLFRSLARIHVHTHTRTHVHGSAHTHTHTHTHTHARVRSYVVGHQVVQGGITGVDDTLALDWGVVGSLEVGDLW